MALIIKQICLFVTMLIIFTDVHCYNNTNEYLLVYKILPPKYQYNKYAFIVVFPLFCKNVSYAYMNSTYTHMNSSSRWQYIENKYTIIYTTNITLQNITIKEHTNKSIDINGENIIKDFVSNQTNQNQTSIFIIYGLQHMTKQINCSVVKTRTLVIPISWECRKNYENSTSKITNGTLQGLLYRRLFNYNDFPYEISSINISEHLIANNGTINNHYKKHKNCSIRERIKSWLYNNTGESETCLPSKYETSAIPITSSTTDQTTYGVKSTTSSLSPTTEEISNLTKTTLLSSTNHIISASLYSLQNSPIYTSVFTPPSSTESAGKWYVSIEILYITVFSDHYIHTL
ncbi:glycoprotein ORF-Q [Elephant endotheliotropic herpesvirus 6]|nr:glycoprotein ORF-Q [Elephant endotheliotropic herpesvirus 6]UEH20661.1 glycoprotein ORF-Q [Elephant endotheliotropic herpesvirus 6]